MYNKKIKAAADRVQSTFSALGRVVVGRSQIIRQALYATVTGQHLLMEGPPGVAKSHMVLQLFKVLQGCKTFKVQCTKKMTEDYLVGPLDMRLFREQGLFVHRTEGMLPDSHMAFIDEIMDLNSGALRALLEVLNERTFTRGLQRVQAPLHTAFATTNFNRDGEEELSAVLDRFLFRAQVKGLSRKEDKKRMLTSVQTEVPALSWRDVRYLNRARQNVEIPANLLDLYLDVCSGLSLTDRTLKKGLEVVRACAVLNGRTTARLTDLTALDTCYIVTNDRSSEQAFAKAFSPYHTAYQEHEASVNLVLIENRLCYLERLIEDASDYEAIESAAIEAREAEAAARHYGTHATARIVSSITGQCKRIFERADYLFADCE